MDFGFRIADCGTVGIMQNRTMPESKAAEAAVLGSMIIDPECIPDVLEIIRGPEAFYWPENRMIFEALIALYEKSRCLR